MSCCHAAYLSKRFLSGRDDLNEICVIPDINTILNVT